MSLSSVRPGCYCNTVRSSAFRRHNTDNILSELNTPAETAIARLDDVLQLLSALGAEVSTGTKESLRAYNSNRLSLIEWVRLAIWRASNRILEAQKDEKSPSRTASIGWEGHRTALLQQITDFLQKTQPTTPNKEEVLDNLNELKSYLVDVERLLVSRRAKTWEEISSDKEAGAIPAKPIPDATPPVTTPERPQYFLLRTFYSSERAPQHTHALYDELYEACFAGNNEKIQKLCFPPEKTKIRASPLQISVRSSTSTSQYNNIGIKFATVGVIFTEPVLQASHLFLLLLLIATGTRLG